MPTLREKVEDLIMELRRESLPIPPNQAYDYNRRVYEILTDPNRASINHLLRELIPLVPHSQQFLDESESEEGGGPIFGRPVRVVPVVDPHAEHRARALLLYPQIQTLEALIKKLKDEIKGIELMQKIYPTQGDPKKAEGLLRLKSQLENAQARLNPLMEELRTIERAINGGGRRKGRGGRRAYPDEEYSSSEEGGDIVHSPNPKFLPFF
jgi:hypothetical protein